MIRHSEIEAYTLHSLIKKGSILMAGNLRLKIYGSLQCRSGKRMKTINRVFFKNENEAVLARFRPCGHCMKESYKLWRS